MVNQIKQESGGTEAGIGGAEDELTCTICLDQVKRGELVRSLPCLHQVLSLPTFSFLPCFLKLFSLVEASTYLSLSHLFCDNH